MKKAIKIASAAAIAVAASGIAAASVFAWGDNTGGRRTYTIAEINAGKLGNKIVLNSIKDPSVAKDGVPEDERFFVGARDASTGNNGVNNVWNNGEITVEEGKTYLVRLYVHNNNPNGEKAVAKDVTTRFSIGGVVDTEQRVDGYITSSNATPSEYWDSVVFKSNNGRKFYLDYVEGSALLENRGIGSAEKNGGKSGVKISDDLISKGVKIGFDKLDGNVPGCYKYSSFVTIQVKPVFEDSSIDKKVRMLGDKEWKTSVDAKVGDKIEYQIHYKNLNASAVEVAIRDSLPNNIKYVAGSTKLFNSKYPNGATTTSDALVENGIKIGSYAVKGDGYVRFTAEVVDNSLVCGSNRLINWAKASPNNGFAVQAHADVYVNKECKEDPKEISYKVTFIDCDKKQTETTVKVKAAGDKAEVTSPWGAKYTVTGDKTIEQTNCTEPTPAPTTPSTPERIPDAGTAGIAATSVLGLGSIVTAAGSYIASRKQLR